jgi:hypothetical protein
MSYDAWQRLTDKMTPEMDAKQRRYLEKNREFAAERARRAAADPVHQTRAVTSVTNDAALHEWLMQHLENFAEWLGEHSGTITREERRFMHQYIAHELARERKKWRQEMSVEVSTALGEMLGIEREKWKRDIYDAVEWANKGSLKEAEVLPMVPRRVTRDDAA